MQSYKKKFNQDDDTCAACGISVETTEHLSLECGSIHPDVAAGTVPEALRHSGLEIRKIMRINLLWMLAKSHWKIAGSKAGR